MAKIYNLTNTTVILPNNLGILRDIPLTVANRDKSSLDNLVFKKIISFKKPTAKDLAEAKAFKEKRKIKAPKKGTIKRVGSNDGAIENGIDPDEPNDIVFVDLNRR